MRDLYAYRRMYGVVTPSVNTCVQPEYDRMRPDGVTNQVARMHVPDLKIASDDDFARGIEALFDSVDAAVDQVMTCSPDHLVLGISALSVWGSTRQSARDLAGRMSARAGGKIPVTLPSDALVAALGALGIKRRVAIVEPYFPVIQPRIEAYFGECGFDVVRFNHMQGGQFTGYTRTTKRALIEELIAIDSPDVEALIQFGANLPMAAIADEAERWLNKPVIAVNIATYWHALRQGGIEDKVQGHTRLLREF
jgi:maleate isomerase